MVKRKIRVLIVDDSLVFRETISKGIAADPSIEVVGTAGDPYQARDKIVDLEPDVMILDVEMPRMNGIEFLKRLMPQYPIPVVVVSAVDVTVFDALKAGAVDFAAKPDFRTPRGSEAFINEIIVKIKIASIAKVGHYKKTVNYEALKGKTGIIKSNIIIAIGASTGGTEALYNIIKAFPRDIPGIVVVQHMPPIFTKLYAERLNNSCVVEVKEAQTHDRILPGRVLIAPGSSHMKIKKSGPDYFVECFIGEKVNGHCPSVDVLFESVAEHAGKNSIGVILTGMGCDGAQGLLAMRRNGARTIGQDEQSCIVYGMPKVAYDINAVEQQAPIKSIPDIIYSLIVGR
ncbi:MAG: protein-glutamate methylesterase/protein-glutamine glutaminase [Ruminiclostridium sp.]